MVSPIKTFSHIFLLVLWVNKTLQNGSNESLWTEQQKMQQKPPSAKRDAMKCKGGSMLTNSVCLSQHYHPGEVPLIPSIINTKFEINNIREIDDKKMTITIEFYQELSWIDNRIIIKPSKHEEKIGGIPLTGNQLQHIWKPDLWIQNLNGFKTRAVFEPSIGLAISNSKIGCEASPYCNETNFPEPLDTMVSFNFEARATIFCNFNFFQYPMDTQTCEFVMSSAYPYANVVIFELQESAFGMTNKQSNTDEFRFSIIFNKMTNGFSGISCIINMERSLLPYIMKYYLPTIAMVIVSFISFLLSLTSIPARVALLVTLFLTLTNILIAQQVGQYCVAFAAYIIQDFQTINVCNLGSL